MLNKKHDGKRKNRRQNRKENRKFSPCERDTKRKIHFPSPGKNNRISDKDLENYYLSKYGD